MTRAKGAVHFARKAFEFAGREVGQAPDMRQARRLAAAVAAVAPEEAGARVLVLSPRSWAAHVQWESLIAQALRLRGAHVSFATCGGGLEVCDRINIHEGIAVPCHSCAGYTRRALASHGFDEARISDALALVDGSGWPELDRLPVEELLHVQADGLPLGEMVGTPARWFLCTSDLAGDPLGAETIRKFLRTARRVAAAVRQIIEQERPEVVLLLNGLFLFEALTAAVCADRGIRVVSYERGFINNTLFFAHGPGASRYDVADLWTQARNRTLSDQEEQRLTQYLQDRRFGLHSFVDLWPKPTFGDILQSTTSDTRRVAMFTNVTWDSAAHAPRAAFPSASHWVRDVLDQLGGRPGVELVIRIHPAEVRIPGWETREPMAEVIAQARHPLPSNVRVVMPDDPLSSYPLMEQADLGLVYTSTVGLEMALLGKPVLVAAGTHYAGKGFTLDAANRDHHRQRLDEMLLDPAAFAPSTEVARRYANLFFFDAAIDRPPAYEPVKGLARLETVNPADLLPGSHRGLDRICDGILHGAHFVGD